MAEGVWPFFWGGPFPTVLGSDAIMVRQRRRSEKTAGRNEQGWSDGQAEECHSVIEEWQRRMERQRRQFGMSAG